MLRFKNDLPDFQLDNAKKSQQSAEKENNDVGLLQEEIQTIEKELRQKENNESTGESKETDVAKRDITRNEKSKTHDENLTGKIGNTIWR